MPAKERSSSQCEHCGKDFPAYFQYAINSWQRFCSRTCSAAHLRLGITERFWQRVDKNGPVPSHRPELGPCWIWTGGKTGAGYGRLPISGTHISARGYRIRKTVLAHRFSWETHYGPIPADREVLHKCDCSLCVNPDHLFLGTQTDNVDDCVAKQRNVRGVKFPQAKLSPELVIEMRELRLGGASLRELSARFGVSESVASQACRKKIWAHVA